MDTLVAVGSAAAELYGIFAIYRIGYGLGYGLKYGDSDFELTSDGGLWATIY